MEFFKGGGGESGSSKRQVRRNFQTDQQKRQYNPKNTSKGGLHPNPADPPQELYKFSEMCKLFIFGRPYGTLHFQK